MTPRADRTDLDASGDLELKHWILVWIDALGQSERLLKLTTLPITEDALADALSTIKETFGAVMTMRRFFRDTFHAMEERDAARRHPDLALREAFSATTRARIIEHFFGDTVVLAIPIDVDKDYCTATNSLWRAMHAVATLSIALLSAGRPLRGAIVVGIAGELPTGDLYGPALVEAHRIESQCADLPRILVADSALRFIQSVEQLEPATPGAKWARHIAAECRRLVCHSDDGRFMLDFMGQHALELSGDEMKKFVPLAVEFVRGEHARFVESGDEKLARRYERLFTYMESRRSNWR